MRGIVRAFTNAVVRRVVAPLLRRAGVRVYQANLHRIGDSLIDVGFYVKARELGWRGRERALVVPGPRTRRPANPCALAHLRRYVRIVDNRWLYPLLFRCVTEPGIGGALFGDLPLPDGRQLDQYLFAMVVEREWEARRRPPLFALDAGSRERGRETLRTLGLADEDWFVCVHVREAGFLREPPTSGHRHLNADVSTYLPAIDWIVEQGGWVIRMGDPSMRPLPPRDRVVDYAHHPAKSAALDVFLAAECRYWLGTNSGLFMLASSFGVPAALTNVAPATFRPWSSRDLFIPKLYRSPALGRQLTFRESLAPELYTSHDIDVQNVVPVDNDPEEILELAVEMHERSAGTLAYDDEAEALQERFVALQPSYYPVRMSCRIGTGFLRRHAALLDDA